LRPEHEAITNAMLLHSQDLLTEWLAEIFSPADINHDFGPSVNDVMKTFASRYTEWVEELRDTHADLIGHDLPEWLPTAVDQFARHLAWYLEEKELALPTNLDEYLRQNALLRVNNLE